MGKSKHTQLEQSPPIPRQPHLEVNLRHPSISVIIFQCAYTKDRDSFKKPQQHLLKNT